MGSNGSSKICCFSGISNNKKTRDYFTEINRFIHFFENREKKWDDAREGLMVIATLIVSVTYSAGVNPPSGMWRWEEDAGSNNGTHVLKWSTDLRDKEVLADLRQYRISNSLALSSSLVVIAIQLLTPSMEPLIIYTGTAVRLLVIFSAFQMILAYDAACSVFLPLGQHPVAYQLGIFFVMVKLTIWVILTVGSIIYFCRRSVFEGSYENIRRTCKMGWRVGRLVVWTFLMVFTPWFSVWALLINYNNTQLTPTKFRYKLLIPIFGVACAIWSLIFLFPSYFEFMQCSATSQDSETGTSTKSGHPSSAGTTSEAPGPF